MDIVLIAAIADNGVIGRNNTLPWRLASDMAHFRALTMGKPVVMGRKTYLSIGKPLPGRTTIVVSRDSGFVARGLVIASSLPSALDVARGDALRRGTNSIMVAGGAEIYAQALPQASRLEITQVHCQPEGDARFPAVDFRLWREAARADHPAGAGDDAGFSYIAYERTPPDPRTETQRPD